MLRALVFFYFILFSSSVFSKEIPVIVISAGKTVQSYSSVGSQVTVINSETIENSPETFLTDLLDNQSQGLNIFQLGSGYVLPRENHSVVLNVLSLFDNL